ncbi:MAG TPA: HNH endonuclease signature motif containing protein, partial [Ktedonobacteraceae bacterium]
VTTDQVCTPGYSKTVRHVPQSVKNEVYAEYGIISHSSGQYEIDHFIPLELGGSNDISNLWPEPAAPQPGFHEKDQVENYLHGQVCSGTRSLTDAQNAIASDWVAVYNQMP